MSVQTEVPVLVAQLGVESEVSPGGRAAAGHITVVSVDLAVVVAVHKGVLYRVYAVSKDKDGQSWYQITPGDMCITKGTAPVCWVCGECGTYTAKQPASPTESLKNGCDGLHVMKCTPASEDAAEALARAMLALRLPVYAAVSAGDAANLKLVAESHGMEFEEV